MRELSDSLHLRCFCLIPLEARALARSRNAKTRRQAARILASADRFETLVERREKVVEQIRKRLAGEPITDRLVSLFDPDARPICKGKLGKQSEFGYVEQLAEVTPNTKRGARGFILPPQTAPGNPGENELLRRRSPSSSGSGSHHARSRSTAASRPKRATRRSPRSPRAHLHRRPRLTRLRRTQRRLARYRVGCEGRISHLKRRHGLRRSRLKGGEGERTWSGWAVFAYNAETYRRYARAEHEHTEQPRHESKGGTQCSSYFPVDPPRPAASVYGGSAGGASARTAWPTERQFPPAATSNRACGSPAHGSPTFFTAGIRRPRCARPGRDRGATTSSIEADQPKLVAVSGRSRPSSRSASVRVVALGHEQRQALERVGADLVEVRAEFP